MRARRLLKWTLVALCVIAAIALFRPFMLAFGPSIYATVIPLLDPRVVIARNFGAGSVTHNMTPVTVTLHEYARNRAHMTTGRSISFRLPKAYSFSSGNQAGGPQYGIHINYHKFTEEPFAFTLRDGAGFRRKNLDGATVRRSRIGVSVSTQQYRAPNV